MSRGRIVQCSACKEYFTKGGIIKHRGSKRCAGNALSYPAKQECMDLRQSLRKQNKKPLYSGNVANALIVRRLGDLCGLERADTKWIEGNYQVASVAVSEYWAHSWVADLWKCYYNKGKSAIFYKELAALNNMSEGDRELRLNLYFLELYGGA